MGKSAKKFYAVLRGRSPGIYDAWFGAGGAHEQVESFPNALYRGFQTLEEARSFVRSQGFHDLPEHVSGEGPGAPRRQACGQTAAMLPEARGEAVVIYADGGCINNPGPGGYGVVILQDGTRRELSGGYRFTTNNRMELMAVITGLRSLEKGSSRPVTVVTDSRYVADGISKGWAQRWKSRGWMRDAKHRAENIDLWSILLDLCAQLKPDFMWVKGHAGTPENERCDVLAKKAAQSPGLPEDAAYEKGETGISQPTLF